MDKLIISAEKCAPLDEPKTNWGYSVNENDIWNLEKEACVIGFVCSVLPTQNVEKNEIECRKCGGIFKNDQSQQNKTFIDTT